MTNLDDPQGTTPHFLRVVRALANVKGPLPLMAVVTVVAGVHCSHASGVLSPSCQSDSDCTAGASCVNNACLCTGFCGMGGGGGVCTSDADCVDGEHCDTTAGFCFTPSGTGGAGGSSASAGGSGGAGHGGGTAGTGGGGASGGSGGSSGKAGAGGA